MAAESIQPIAQASTRLKIPSSTISINSLNPVSSQCPVCTLQATENWSQLSLAQEPNRLGTRT